MKRIITIAILFFVNSLHAAVQLELKGYDILGETKPGPRAKRVAFIRPLKGGG